MAKHFRERGQKNPLSFLKPLAPFLIPGGVILFLFFYFKNKGGLIGGIKSFLGIGSDPVNSVLNTVGAGYNQDKLEENKKIIEDMKTTLGKKNLVVTSRHRTLALSIYDNINASYASSMITQVFGSLLDKKYQKEVLKIFQATNDYDWACIYVAYGTKSCKNRANMLLGLLWDDTNGNLRYHVERFFDGGEKTTILRCIDSAIKLHLS